MSRLTGRLARWLDHPRAGARIAYALFAACGLLLLVELVYHRSGYFPPERWFGFYAVTGFGAYLAVVFTAKGLRRLVRRPEDYYDREPGDG